MRPHRGIPRWRGWALAWLGLVLALHAWTWQAWRDWQPLAAAPPPRLAVQLTRALRPTDPGPPPPSLPLSARSVARWGTAALPAEPAASLPDAELAKVLPALPEVAPASEPPPQTAATARDGDDRVGPEWPLSTRLRYAVVGNYQGPVHGDAEVEWLRQGARYQVRLRVGIGPKLTPFGQRRLVSEGRLTASGIAPQRYDEETQFLWRTARALTLHFDPGQVQLPQGQRVFAPAGVQDSASQFVHLTWLLLTGREPSRAGHVIPVPLALSQGVSTWRYENLGEVALDTALGRIRAWHLRPQPPFPAGALAAQVWLAPSYQYLPVQIRIEQGDGVWMTLTLAEAPLQEAPPADNPAPSKENPP